MYRGGGRTFNEDGEVTNFSENTTYNPSFNGHMQTRLSKASPQHTWVHGFALSNVFEFSSQLKAMAAIRYDHYSYRHTSGLSIKDGKHSYDDVARDKYEKSSDDAISYRLGLVYQQWKLFHSILLWGASISQIRQLLLILRRSVSMIRWSADNGTVVVALISNLSRVISLR